MPSTMSVIATLSPPVGGDLPDLRRPTPGRLHRLAQELARRTDLWASRVQFAHDTRYSVRVAVTDDYEAWLLTWLPGQSTGLHDVFNTGNAPAVSLHVYAPALETMRRFVLDELGRPQVVSLERSGADW